MIEMSNWKVLKANDKRPNRRVGESSPGGGGAGVAPPCANGVIWARSLPSLSLSSSSVKQGAWSKHFANVPSLFLKSSQEMVAMPPPGTWPLF